MKLTTVTGSAANDRVTSTCICKGLRISGLDKGSTLVLTNLIMKWVRKSGEEWTVNRLKAIKVYYLQSLAGYPDQGKPDWVRINRSGVPRGFSKVFKLKKPQKVLSALMSYTTFVARNPTRAQIEKFVRSVTATDIPVTQFVLKGLSTPQGDKPLLTVPAYPSRKVMDKYPAHYGWFGFWKPELHAARRIRVPQLVGKYDPSTGYYVPEVVSVPMSVHAQSGSGSFHPAIRRWLDAQYNKTPLSEVFVIPETNRMVGPVPYQCTAEQQFGYCPVGKIGFLQEPGYKLRAVANPLPLFQLALSRLGRALKEELKQVAEDCTFNQDSGVRAIQEALKGGLELSSIDLSDATNLFPYSLTREVVIRVPNVIESDVVLWDEVVRGYWQMPDKSYIQWTKGQPLGVYPSFFAFALSHHSLAKSVSPQFYRIVGDDIVIDREAGERLKDLYLTLGCEISLSKTITSSVMAEFAGKIILPDRVLTQPKWRSISDRNFVELCQNLGPRALGYLKPRQRRVIKPLVEMPRALHPLALGFNPKGKPYEQRVEEAKPFLEALSSDDTDVFLTPLGAELARLSWLIKLRAERPEIAQGLEYSEPAHEEVSSVDSASSLRLRVPDELADLSKDELVMFLKAAEATYGRKPVYDWPKTVVDAEKLMQEVQDRVHFVSGITRLEVNRNENKATTHGPAFIESGDPRGCTTLVALERKFRSLLQREAKVKEQRLKPKAQGMGYGR